MTSLVARLLQEKGYVVDVCAEARDGFKKACETLPDCIICNPDLPDIDGAWVARRIRTEGGHISKVPFLFVGEVIDKSVRTQALGVGVDVFLARPPASNDEIVAQVDALIAQQDWAELRNVLPGLRERDEEWRIDERPSRVPRPSSRWVQRG